MVWYSHLFKNFPQFFVIHTVKGFGIVNKADVFPELSCFFDDPMNVGNLISDSSAFSKSNLNIWKFTVHVLLKPGLENFEDYFASGDPGAFKWRSGMCVCWACVDTCVTWDANIHVLCGMCLPMCMHVWYASGLYMCIYVIYKCR